MVGDMCVGRFIKYFDPVYYLKPLPGGFLVRVFHESEQKPSLLSLLRTTLSSFT